MATFRFYFLGFGWLGTIAEVDFPFVVVVVDKRQMADNKYLSRQPGHRQM